MQIHSELEQRSDEWHRLRLGKITGSSIHKLLGTSATAEKYLYEKASEIITGSITDNEAFKNIHIQRGLEYEAAARRAYIFKNYPDVDVTEVGLIQIGDYVACSPDGLVNDDGMIEIKVPDSTNFLKLILEIAIKGIDAIPVEHRYQMQFNLYVSGRKWCDYVLYNPKHAAIGKGLFVYRIEPDQDLQIRIGGIVKSAPIIINEYVDQYYNIMGAKDK